LLLCLPNEGSAQSSDAGGGSSDYTGYRILGYRNGTEVELVGILTEGVTEELARSLKANPQAEVLHLNSFGGLGFEGERLFELIRSHGLTTYTSGWCYSACTTAFLGGRERLIARGARLGFHRPAGPGLTTQDVDKILDRESIILSSYLNIPADFLRKAHSTPHESMWYPTLEELQRANVVTGVAAPGQFATTGFGDKATPESVATMLEKISPFDSVRRLDPTAFAAIRDVWLAAFTEARPWEEVAEEARAQLGELFDRHVAESSDDAIIAYGAAVLQQMESVGGSRPDTCVALIVGEPDEAIDALNLLLTLTVRREKSAAYEQIFATALTAHQSPPTERQVRPLLDRVMRELRGRYGSKVEILSRKPLPSSQYAAACDMWIVYLKEILAAPPADASRILRYLYSGTEADDPDGEDEAAASDAASSMPALIPSKRDGK
jgi:hypothetical protein